MAIRRKERPLTLEEIKEKVIKATKEFWVQSEPLCAYTNLIDGGRLIPLVPRSENAILILFFIDAADYTSGLVLERIAQWLEDYKKLPWIPIVVFRRNYLFLENPKYFERFKNKTAFATLAIYMDEKDEWHKFFKVDSPAIVFSQAGDTLYTGALNEDFTEHIFQAEKSLQEIMRSKNPGLPLLEVLKVASKRRVDLKKTQANELSTGGYWTQLGNQIATDDPNAKLSFSFQGTGLRFIALAHHQAREHIKAIVMIDDNPIPKNAYGSQLHPGDKGHAIVEINRYTGIYELIRSENTISGTITLKFLNTLENPVIVYGLRVI